MRYVQGHPTIRQVKRWCENRDLVIFQSNLGTSFKGLILEVKPSFLQDEEDYNPQICLQGRSECYELWDRVNTWQLHHIVSYIVPEKIDSILLKPEKFSKKDVILRYGNVSRLVNKKLLASRSIFFQELIQHKEKELSWKFFTFISKYKRPISINLHHLFNDEHELDLFLCLLDREEIDDFIHTPQDALSLFECLNKYPLRKSQSDIQQIENQLKSKFFELIGHGLPFVKPDADKLSKKAQLFLNNLKQELIAYCKREETKPCRNLLSYCTQIEKNNRLFINASTHRDYFKAIRLLVFCNFEIFTLITVGVSPELFTKINLNDIPLHTLKMYPYPPKGNVNVYSYYCERHTKPLFNLIISSKTLSTVQIGNNNKKKAAVTSYLQDPDEPGFCFTPEIMQQFNSLKPILDTRLSSFYEKAVISPFFGPFLPQQQRRILTEFLTKEDLENLRQTSRQIYVEANNLMHSSIR